MNKTSADDGIPAELFQTLNDAVQVLNSIWKQILKTQQWPQDWKMSVSFQSQRRAMPKKVQTTTQLYSFHMLARPCSKSFKLGFNSPEFYTMYSAYKLNPEFHTMYTAYKLNKQSDNMQPWRIVPNLEPACCSMSSSNCCFLTCILVSQKAGPVVW